MNTSSIPQNNASQLNRRQWLATGLSSLAGLAGMHTTRAQAAAEEPAQAKLKFSSWLKPVHGDLKQQLDFVERSGFEAVELRGTIANNKQSWLKALKDRPLKVSGMDWGHFTLMVSDSAAERQKAVDSLKAAIDAAHELSAPVLVCVPPRYGQPTSVPDAATSRKILLETLTPLGEMAAKAGTCIGIEPVRRKSVNCLHTLVDGASFCREAKSPGFCIVADFCIMMEEETNLTGAMLSGGSYIHQVHLANRGRNLPGENAEDERPFLEGFRGLKMIGYNGYCSFEGGQIETYEQNVGKCMTFLRDLWARA